jgi:hypothetical protein
VYLLKPDFVKYMTDLPQSRKILLAGPTGKQHCLFTNFAIGTEIYQERLVRALAKHFKASLIIIDPSCLEYERCSDKKEKGDEDSNDIWEPFEISTKSREAKPKFKRGNGCVIG